MAKGFSIDRANAVDQRDGGEPSRHARRVVSARDQRPAFDGSRYRRPGLPLPTPTRPEYARSASRWRPSTRARAWPLEAVGALITYLFETLNKQRLSCTVMSTTHPVIVWSRRTGFRREGDISWTARCRVASCVANTRTCCWRGTGPHVSRADRLARRPPWATSSCSRTVSNGINMAATGYRDGRGFTGVGLSHNAHGSVIAGTQRFHVGWHGQDRQPLGSINPAGRGPRKPSGARGRAGRP